MRVVEAILKIAPSQVNFAYFHTNLGSSSQFPLMGYTQIRSRIEPDTHFFAKGNAKRGEYRDIYSDTPLVCLARGIPFDRMKQNPRT